RAPRVDGATDRGGVPGRDRTPATGPVRSPVPRPVAVAADGSAAAEVVESHAIAEHRLPDGAAGDPAIGTDDRLGDRRVTHHAAPLDGDIGADCRSLDDAARLDQHRLDDPHVAAEGGVACGALLEQDPVGLQRGAELAAVVPAGHLRSPDLAAVLDHVLERVGQVVLTLHGRRGEHVIDSGPQGVDVADPVEADVGELADRRRRLLDDARHVAILVGDHYAEALVVLHLARPDHAVGVGVAHDA